MVGENKYRAVITESLKLIDAGQHAAALKLLDEFITIARQENDVSWWRRLCHHAAIVSRFGENLESAQRYYEASLETDPEDVVALYGLAAVNLDNGRLEVAKSYAERCRNVLLELENDHHLKQGYWDLLMKHWPDIGEKQTEF